MNTTNEPKAPSHDAEAELFKRYKGLVEEVRATTNLNRVKADLYARMRARTSAPARKRTAPVSTGAGERPLSEVRFLTVAEAAAVMRVPKMVVYRFVHSGELPAIRVGRSHRIPEQAVHDYLRDADDLDTFDGPVDAPAPLAETGSGVTTGPAIANLGELSPNEEVLVAQLQGMRYPPAEIAGAVLLMRRYAARRTRQEDSHRKEA